MAATQKTVEELISEMRSVPSTEFCTDPNCPTCGEHILVDPVPAYVWPAAVTPISNEWNLDGDVDFVLPDRSLVPPECFESWD
jgi:hypothetical protein